MPASRRDEPWFGSAVWFNRASAAELDRVLLPAWRKWFATLPRDQADALRVYKSMGHTRFALERDKSRVPSPADQALWAGT